MYLLHDLRFQELVNCFTIVLPKYSPLLPNPGYCIIVHASDKNRYISQMSVRYINSPQINVNQRSSDGAVSKPISEIAVGDVAVGEFGPGCDSSPLSNYIVYIWPDR